jgi:hypothetical protein
MRFALTVSDLSTGKTSTNSFPCSTCTRSSAEWIIERPAFNNDAIDIVNPDANGDGGFCSLDTVGPVSGKSFTAYWQEPGDDRPDQFLT